LAFNWDLFNDKKNTGIRNSPANRLTAAAEFNRYMQKKGDS